MKRVLDELSEFSGLSKGHLTKSVTYFEFTILLESFLWGPSPGVNRVKRVLDEFSEFSASN